jgi:hypothetical protein
VVFTHPHIIARVNARAALANQYRASINRLPGIPFDTESLPLTVPTIAAGSRSFFMRHLLFSPLSSYAVVFSP